MVEVSAGVTAGLTDSWTIGIGGDVSTTENPDEEAVRSSLAWLGTTVETGRSSSLNLRMERTDDELNPETVSGKISFELEL